MTEAAAPLPEPAPGKSEAALEDPTRRGFLAATANVLAACTGAACLGPAVLAVLSPADGGIVRLGDGTIDVGPLESFEEGVPRKVVIRGARTDAYFKMPERSLGSVVVIRKGATITVLSTVCPHAGCEVLVGAELVCPCHDSKFALDGSVLAGPSPRGLDPLESQVAQGHVRVKFERFQVGVAERRPV